MTQPMKNQLRLVCVSVVAGLLGVVFAFSAADAKSSQSSDGRQLKPACDYRAHPTITMVTPNHAKPGQKIMINGKNFGTKTCFHSVSFGPKSTDAWTYVSSTMVEATVPNLKPGMVPVTVSTEGGTSQFQLDVQTK